MSPDVFFVVFRPWIGLALGGIRALRRIAVGIPAFVGEFERPRRVWRPSSRAVGGILSAAGMPRRRGVGFVHAVVYDFHVWLRERVDRVAMLERIQTHLFSALFCLTLLCFSSAEQSKATLHVTPCCFAFASLCFSLLYFA